MNSQTTSAMIHSFVIVTLMVSFSWLGLADFSWQKTPDPLELLQTRQVPFDQLPIRLSHEINVLKRAQRIESHRIGAGARHSELYQAYRTIRSSQEAELIFTHLLNDENIITKIYAKKGLQYLNSPLFRDIQPYFTNSHLSVRQIGGCVVFKKEVRETIKDRWPWN